MYQVNPKAAESLADPEEYPNLFDDWQIALDVEATIAPKRYMSFCIFIELSDFVKL
jgi:coatomer subunit beta'